MNYLYKHKHKKPHPTTIQLKRWSKLILQKIKLFDTLVEIDLKPFKDCVKLIEESESIPLPPARFFQ